VASRPAGAEAQTDSLATRLRIFQDVLRLVRANYVDEVNAPALVDAAIAGALAELDPHTNHVDPRRLEQISERNRGDYDGIGISFALRGGEIVVVSAIEDTPGDRLGIRPGDTIVEIDGVPARGWNEAQVFAELRGPEGSRVRLGIRRAGTAEVMSVEIVRARIPIKSVPYWFMLDASTGYIRMVRFSATSAEEITTVLGELSRAGMRRLLLDLRGNPGGYLEQAVAVADQFLPGDRLVVTTRGRVAGASGEHRTSGSARYGDLPLVVLIDHGTASAAEILAGAVQDWDRGLIAGETSFGKGLVQRQYRLADGSALFLTVGRYYTPSGRLIQRDYAADRVSYYAAAYDELDPNAAGADTAAFAPPRHLTAAGREVRGAGGITPDRLIARAPATDRWSALERTQAAFTFANGHVARSGFAYPAGSTHFLAHYEPDEAIWQAFLAHVAAADLDLDLTSADLAAERPAILASVKQEMAGRLWGPTARYQVLIAADPVVARARELFPEASALLAPEAALNLEPGPAPDGHEALPTAPRPGENPGQRYEDR
jgi:carboxyl-terminal processing protease